MLLFTTCKKNNTASSSDEYIHYIINGVPYNFDMPVDSVFADSLAETASFTTGKNIIGKKSGITTTDFTRITYNKNNTSLTPGSQATIVSFYTPQTGLYPQFATTVSPVLMNFTEVGAVNEYIAGNFSAVFTASPSISVYTITCNFRVRRRI
jgi:hypothetical protein